MSFLVADVRRRQHQFVDEPVADGKAAVREAGEHAEHQPVSRAVRQDSDAQLRRRQLAQQLRQERLGIIAMLHIGDVAVELDFAAPAEGGQHASGLRVVAYLGGAQHGAVEAGMEAVDEQEDRIAITRLGLGLDIRHRPAKRIRAAGAGARPGLGDIAVLRLLAGQHSGRNDGLGHPARSFVGPMLAEAARRLGVGLAIRHIDDIEIGGFAVRRPPDRAHRAGIVHRAGRQHTASARSNELADPLSDPRQSAPRR